MLPVEVPRVFVTAGALLRFAVPFALTNYTGWLELSALLWGGAFLLFLIAYGPSLLGPRADGRL